jgi:SPP1 gp7 family putative phage head morphogenesis protein
VQVLADAIPFVIKISGVDVGTLKAAATSRPFQGKLLSEWFSTLEQVDQDRIRTAVKKGLTLGEDLNSIVKRVVGTSSKAFGDGTLAETRRNAEAITRTAINHTANSAREEIWKANEDILLGLMWNSTLDGRTSAVCRARDGQVAFYNEKHGSYPALSPQGARPPAHINCRSGMVPIISPEEVVGQRAFVTDTRTTKEREVDFRQTAKADAGPKWKDMTPQERQDSIRRVRENWARANIGQVPSNFTYQDWLKKQPAAFQDEVLGVTKGKLFRDGGLKLDNYVDRAGSELTIDELRDRYPGAFDKAGVE